MFVAARRNVSRRETASSHLITHISARSVVTGSYGKIVSTCDRHTTTRIDTGPPYGRTASVLVAPACKHPPEVHTPERIPAAGRCFKSSCLFYPSVRSALSGANFTWLFVFFPSFPRSVALRCRPLSRLFCSLFTHRLPTALSFPLSSVFSEEEEFAVISQCLKSRYRDFAPRPLGPRYQTAGSIGALARDEPVTPGVTFLSPPAPNSGDSEDR
jgi:hypothetical protein